MSINTPNRTFGVLIALISLASVLAFSQSQDQSGSPTPSANTAPQGVPKRARVSADLMNKLVKKRVNPDYSKDLRKQKIQGLVTVAVRISKDGDVVDVKPISGPAELTQAATEAVKQWKYFPFLLKGEPVEVETQVQINFTLAGG